MGVAFMAKSSEESGLAAVRRARGLSQERAADLVGVSVSTWGRWERGKMRPHRAQITDIAKAFGVTEDQAFGWVEGTTKDASPWLAGQINTGSVAATVDDACKLWKEDVDPTRRALLRALPFAPVAMQEWLLSYTLDPAPEHRGSIGDPRRVGMEDVHKVRDAIDGFIAMDHLVGGGLVRPAITDYLHTQVAPLLRGSYNDETGSQLMAAASVMTGLAGWEAYDMAHHGLAQAHYRQALALAKGADDPLTAAWVLSTAAQQAIDLNQPTLAERLARGAQLAGQRAGACPRVRAALLVREARAVALKAELSETPDTQVIARAERLLGEAEEALGAVSPGDDEPHWAQDLGVPELTAEAGCVRRMIGQYAAAERAASEALAGFDAAYARSTQFNLTHRGQALVGLGELDEAIAAARHAVSRATGLQSVRSIALLRDFDRSLDPYARDPRVRQWRDYLRSALPTAA